MPNDWQGLFSRKTSSAIISYHQTYCWEIRCLTMSMSHFLHIYTAVKQIYAYMVSPDGKHMDKVHIPL